MMQLVGEHIKEIRRLCQQYNVEEMYVFGSVLNSKFTFGSDVDFLVRFSGVDLLDYFDNYMSLKERLAASLSRNIDLVEVQTLKNPILKQSIDRDKVLVYGRENTQMFT